MNNQEVFDKVAIHLLAQNKKSINDLSSRCRYRGLNGLRCAIGALIPDYIYDPEIEGGNVFSEKVLNCLIRSGVYDYDDDEKFELLRGLQKIHDHYEPNLWEEKLRHLAKKHNLETTKIDHFKKRRRE